MALMDGTRPCEHAGNFETVQFDIAVKTGFDLEADNGLTVAVRRQAIELTRAAVGTIAVREFERANRPIDRSHDIPRQGKSLQSRRDYAAKTRITQCPSTDVMALTSGT